MNSPLRILYITTWCPFPADNGSKIRTAYLLRALARHHDVTLLTFSPDGLSADDIAAQAPPLAGIYPVHEDPFRYNSLPSYVKYASPMPIAFWKSPAMTRQATALAAGPAFDVVAAMSVPVARYPFQLRHTPRLLDLEQSHTLVLEDRYRAASTTAARQRALIGWRKSAFYEARFIRAYQATTLVSQHEVDYYTPMIRDASTRLSIIPNGVDLDRMQPNMAARTENHLVFNGALTYSVNYDAMQYFLRDVYPRIKQRVADASLTITGSTHGVDLNGLRLDTSVNLSGYVPDIRPLVAGATVCVAPLRQGAGTRLKILEAMALGTPVVSTSKGIEGLNAVPERDFLLADNPQSFAAQTIRLLEDADLRCSLALNARGLIEREYNWMDIGARFCRLIEEVVSEQATRRS